MNQFLFKRIYFNHYNKLFMYGQNILSIATAHIGKDKPWIS